jgi:drug/metabolite transporter (DMT)-like permease
MDLCCASKEESMETKTQNRLVLIAFVLTVIFAGNNAIAVHYSNVELSPFFGAGIRFFLASLILFVVVLAMRLPLPRGRSLQGALIYGFLGTGLNYAFLYWALEHIQAGLTMTILALTPLLTFLFAWAHKQEGFRWKAVFGSLLALAGIGVIAWDQISVNAPLLPMLAVAAAAACFAESSVFIKNYPKAHPVTTNAISLLTGSILLFIFSAISRETPTLPTLPATWAALVYLIIFGSVIVFVLTLYVIQHWTASASSYVFVLMPIVTITMGAWLTQESITAPFLLGAAFVLSGAYIGGIANTDLWKCYFIGLFARFRTPTPECE